MKFIQSLTHLIHKYFLPILLTSYLCAGLAPQFGIWLREISLGNVNLPGLGDTKISLSLIMLSFLLFNAGLGIKAKELLGLKERPNILIFGFLANILVPIILIVGLRGLLGVWHNPDELQNLLVGLALIIAMPIAGSSTAWAQNANGNLSLSLGLVFLSTILSPFTTPLVLHLFGFMTGGDYSEDLHELAEQGTNTFLCLTVVAPAILGMISHYFLGDKKTVAIKPLMKLTNFVFLLLLNYSNASLSLPGVFKKPDWDFLALIMLITVLVCVFAFASGGLLAKLLKANNSDKAALMFSLGMNNNGTGLVLAAAALADHPAVMLPMIFYTMVQQVVAAIVDWKVFKAQD